MAQFDIFLNVFIFSLSQGNGVYSSGSNTSQQSSSPYANSGQYMSSGYGGGMMMSASSSSSQYSSNRYGGNWQGGGYGSQMGDAMMPQYQQQQQQQTGGAFAYGNQAGYGMGFNQGFKKPGYGVGGGGGGAPMGYSGASGPRRYFLKIVLSIPKRVKLILIRSGMVFLLLN